MSGTTRTIGKVFTPVTSFIGDTASKAFGKNNDIVKWGTNPVGSMVDATMGNILDKGLGMAAQGNAAALRSAKTKYKQGVKTEDLLNNLQGDPTQLTKGKYRTGMFDMGGALLTATDSVRSINETQLKSLNVRFQNRSNEILNRQQFQGRDQLILTDRDD